MFIWIFKLSKWFESVDNYYGWAKKSKKSNRSKNQTKTKSNGSILVFVLDKSQFRLTKYKNRGFS